MLIEQVQSWLADAQRVVGFTGAGISTECGIPDFRSPDGVWATNRTVMFDEFLRSYDDRVEYWRQKAAMWPEMRDAEPGAGHRAYVRLHETGRLSGMITQNIEGLHQRSGLPTSSIIELHGTTTRADCLSCLATITMDEACERVAAGDLAPECECGGYFKPATISFGQDLVPEHLYRASALCRDAEVCLVAGSSLVVQPAAGFPEMAKRHGAKLVIVNRDATPLDGFADAVFHDEIGVVMPQLVDGLT